jgi:predicted CoA-substrate-specific enzyme activase
VYAKTDIQPLLNQGVAKSDIALSSLHAVAKQTIGGLAQGLEVEPPVLFEGGPLTYNPTLVKVFAQRLGLSGNQIIVPDYPELIVAHGAALAAGTNLNKVVEYFDVNEAIKALRSTKGNGYNSHDNSCEFCESMTPTAKEPLFTTEQERRAFELRHASRKIEPPKVSPGDTLRVWLGIDSGSTTTKLVFLDEQGVPIESFYASNKGEPLAVAKDALKKIHEKYQALGVEIEVLGAGSTGYGEMMFARGFHLDYHAVETVAHAHAARHYLPEVSFVLDIGGQDMKAIWMDGGVITDILMNEACSSGCGSFLENFATSLNINLEDIADVAFSSKSPARLGSRCTVFMNSSIVSEQRQGKSPADIMAGLVTSIIENVFSKVIRLSNFDALGSSIMVQGGTFQNDAVLRAFERVVGREVHRAPYPGLMGAIGVALLTKERMERESERVAGENAMNPRFSFTFNGEGSVKSHFIGFDALNDFSYTQTSGLICPFCTNRCNRTLIKFSDGTSWITHNRCAKGEVVGDISDALVQKEVHKRAKAAKLQEERTPNLFKVREKLLFASVDVKRLAPLRSETIGIPRVLGVWDSAPFWRGLFESLGFTVVFSRESNREMYEKGLSGVASDTVCFPAKLVHGHVNDLIQTGVDSIFMPIITVVAPEGQEDTAESMCAIVKGYPMVMRASDNPEAKSDIPFDTPLFHWYTAKDRDKQLTAYLKKRWAISEDVARCAINQAEKAQKHFKDKLKDAGAKVLAAVEKQNGHAVVLASRPYQNDPLVNHDLPRLFCEEGVAVLTVDSLPSLEEVDLSKSRLDIANNFHARMLAGALIAARSPYLDYVQIVSFGCGHDAYLSDEIIRLMRETSDDVPLILKVDESSVEGPLRIRVRSFVETIELKRISEKSYIVSRKQLDDPYPVKFDKTCKDNRMTVLIPNTSHAFSRMMAAVFSKQGLNAVPLEVGRKRAIELGKHYVHNDICFPAQIVIGECLAALESGKYDLNNVCIGMGKYVGDCRLTHYSALLRKALDDAGYTHVPILTNDDVDSHNMHPGFKMNILSAMRIAYALPMIDALEELLRKMRPYEIKKGASQDAFEKALDALIEGIDGGFRTMNIGFTRAIQIMNEVEYDRSKRHPRVLIVGEYLLNFHPGANRDIEHYLERNGFEIVEARMTDVIRKTYFYKHSQVKEFGVNKPLSWRVMNAISDRFFDLAHNNCDKIAKAHPLYEPPCRMPDLVKASDDIVHHTFDAGEGVLIPAEIIHNARKGVEAFVILQPFGCLPNHIVGRGIVARLKRDYPNAHILSLDYDPDVSFANIENRLQMLVMSIKEEEIVSR